MMKSQDLPVIGWVELVDLPEFGMKAIPAKIDTGAFTGALHCEFEKIVTENGKEWLEYRPLDSDRTIRTQEFEKDIFYSSNGTHEERHRIKTTVIIKGVTYPLSISLTDRSEMTYDILLGRAFLSGKFIIDPSKTNGKLESERQ